MRITPILAMYGCLMLAGCTSVSSNSTAVRDMTDTELANAVRARLEADPALQAAKLSVSADVKKNEVTLSGDVASESLRTSAVQAAKNYRADLRVVDKIDVKPPEITRADYTEQMAEETRVKAKNTGSKIGKSLDDAWIHTKITTKLAADSPSSVAKINVDVVNNAVTLRGHVKTADAKVEAERIAKNTDGVKKVTNLLTVKDD